MIRKWNVLLVIVIMLAWGVAGCGTTPSASPAPSEAPAVTPTAEPQSEEPAGERVIKHLAGETVISGTPSRVVVLEFGLLSTVYSFNVHPVGISDDGEPDKLDELGLLEPVGEYTSTGSRPQPNLEVIRMLNPDLIIGDYARHGAIYKELSDIAPTIMLSDTKATYDDAANNHLTIGEALNKKAEAEQYIADHETLLKQTIEKMPQDKSYLLLVLQDKEMNARTNLYFSPSMLEKAGLNYALKSSDETSLSFSIEQLLEIDPDVLFVTREEFLAQWEADPLFRQLKAYQNDQIFPVIHGRWAFNRSLSGANNVLADLNEIIPRLKP